MRIEFLALLINFIGAICVGISSQFGFASGWGGLITFKSKFWRILNACGWVMLICGFGLQIYTLEC